MELENCASGAPRRGAAYSPTGFRRLTPGLLKVDRAAEGFTGLPEGLTVHGQLLATFKAAAPRLGLPARVVHAIDWLFKFTQPQDWEREGRPIVWPSASLEQEVLGLSETQAKRLNRCLIETGLVTMNKREAVSTIRARFSAAFSRITRIVVRSLQQAWRPARLDRRNRRSASSIAPARY